MARIRTIKPEFFTSEDIVALTPHARLLYIALWCEADKEGRMAWKPKTFKMRYLPADTVDIDSLCAEIIAAGLVKLYGEGYAYIPCFNKHQHVNPRESLSVLPQPPDFVPSLPKKISADVRSEVMERDGCKCVRCNSADDLTLDHILPQSLGGPHIPENLRVMCRSCNSGRPVSGKGLVSDLEIDGLSIEGLKSKFGIDASSRVGTRETPNVHAQVGREGKGKEIKEHASAREQLFNDFWTAYPKKIGKDEARKAFEKRKPNEQLVDLMVTAVEQQKRSETWLKDGGQFIPNPATWLNQGRWQDDVGPIAANSAGFSNPMFAGAI